MNAAAGLQFGDFTLDVAERVLRRGGRPVPLTPKAFDVLAALAARPGRLVTKDELLSDVWPDAFVEEGNLAYHVFAVRKALGENGGETFIETVPRRGYRFVAPVTAVGAVAGGGEGEVARPGEARAGEGAPPPVPDPVSHPGRSTSSARRPGIVWLAAGAASAAAVLVLLYTAAPTPSRVEARVEIATPIRLTESSAFAISPDGLHLVFAGSGDDGVVRLWVRSLSDSDARPLPGTEVELGGLVPPMFWSPDNRHVAFDAAGHLKKVDVMGGAPQTICRLPALAVGGSWSRDGVVVVGTPQSGIFSCPASGGPASLVTRVDPSQQHAAHVLPSFLPDGRHFVYLAVSRTAPERTGIYVHALDAPATSSVRLLAAGFGAAYVHDDERDQGHLLFVRDGALLAQAFDAARLRLSGDAVRIAGPVGSFLDGAFFSASATGTLVFTPPAAPRRLAWLDREGNVIDRIGEPGPYSGLSLAPDDTRAVIVEHPVRATLEQDLWIVDLPSGRASKITFDGALEDRPIWSGDGTRIVFTVTGGVGSLFEMSASGGPSPRVLLESSEHKVPDSISADGESLLFTSASIGPSRLDVWVLPLTGERVPYPLIRRPFDQSDAQLSPDGRWVAYVSNESGRQQVLLRPFEPPADEDAAGLGERVVISTSGGMSPRWRKDGSELFFTTPAGAVLAVSVASGSGSTVEIGSPHVLFHAPGMAEDWAVSADGQRFLVLRPETPTPGTSFSLVLDWQAALDSMR